MPDHTNPNVPLTRVQGRIPRATNITHLGISAQAASGLTPKAKTLTKSDLVALGGPNGAARSAQLGLTVKDINSIKQAFSGPLHIGGVGHGGDLAAMDVSCCCCTPCCCAAASMEPLEATA